VAGEEEATGEGAAGTMATGGLIPGIWEYGGSLQGLMAAAALSRE
jgi:hypothetical protein